MFARLFKQKNAPQTTGQIAQGLYEAALIQTRKPEFYTECGVPDSFDGRFDLLLVNIFILLRHMKDHLEYEEISQALFDATFKNMDQTLREMGIGDMGIPKHMKRMMKAFNGRMHSYLAAIDPDSLNDVEIEGIKKTTLEEALRRNLFGTVEGDDLNANHPAKIAHYIRVNLENGRLEDYSKPEFIDSF